MDFKDEMETERMMHSKTVFARLGLALLWSALVIACGCRGNAGDAASAGPATRSFKPVNVYDATDVRIPAGGQLSR